MSAFSSIDRWQHNFLSRTSFTRHITSSKHGRKNSVATTHYCRSRFHGHEPTACCMMTGRNVDLPREPGNAPVKVPCFWTRSPSRGVTSQTSQGATLAWLVLSSSKNWLIWLAKPS